LLPVNGSIQTLLVNRHRLKLYRKPPTKDEFLTKIEADKEFDPMEEPIDGSSKTLLVNGHRLKLYRKPPTEDEFLGKIEKYKEFDHMEEP
ncbi:hypothetical protein KI387_033702, partial [Taxus chinensis]